MEKLALGTLGIDKNIVLTAPAGYAGEGLTGIQHFSKLAGFTTLCQIANDRTCFVEHKL